MRPDAQVLGPLIAKLRHRAERGVHRVRGALKAAWRPKGVFAGVMADVTRTRSELLAENAILRQQLIVAACAKLRTHNAGCS